MPTVLYSGVEPDLIHTHITTFNAFASLGVFSTIVALAPALFSPRVTRSAAWFGLLSAWLVYSVSYILLFGRQFDSKPPLGLCIFQAALVYATSALCGVASTCFAIDFFLNLSTVKLKGQKISRKTENLLIAVPWIIGLAVTGEAVLVIGDALTVQPDPNHFYCHIQNSMPTLTNIVIICLCGLVIIPVEIYTAILLYQNWTVIKRLNGNHAGITLSILIRLALFSLVVIIAIGLALYSVARFGDYEPAWGIVLITLPTFSALCFGTQRDILRAWLFWKREAVLPVAPAHAPRITTIPGRFLDV